MGPRGERGGAPPGASARFRAACDPPALRLAGAFGPRAGTGKEEPVGSWPCRRRAGGVGGAAAWPPFPEGDARGRGVAGPCVPVLPFPGDAGRGRGGRLARVGRPCAPPVLSCGGLGRPAAPSRWRGRPLASKSSRFEVDQHARGRWRLGDVATWDSRSTSTTGTADRETGRPETRGRPARRGPGDRGTGGPRGPGTRGRPARRGMRTPRLGARGRPARRGPEDPRTRGRPAHREPGGPGDVGLGRPAQRGPRTGRQGDPRREADQHAGDRGTGGPGDPGTRGPGDPGTRDSRPTGTPGDEDPEARRSRSTSMPGTRGPGDPGTRGRPARRGPEDLRSTSTLRTRGPEDPRPTSTPRTRGTRRRGTRGRPARRGLRTPRLGAWRSRSTSTPVTWGLVLEVDWHAGGWGTRHAGSRGHDHLSPESRTPVA